MCVNRGFPSQYEQQKKRFKTVLTRLKAQGLKLPQSIVSNPVAQSYIT